MGLIRWLFRRQKRSAFASWQRASSPPKRSGIYLDEEGRRHRTDIPYMLPQDEKELLRLDYQHFVLRQALRGNTFAPVHDLLTHPSHILDIGCGTGRWGTEMARAYPQAQVIGFDIEVMSPPTSPSPNVQFQQGNL